MGFAAVRVRRWALLVLTCAALTAAPDGASAQRVAKYGADFLGVGVGGRALGMGGAYVALSDDVHSGYWNAAGLAQTRYPQAAYMHVERFAGVVTFDEETWKELVVDWVAKHTEYRLNEELPPADPVFGWECQFCSYRNRCGRGDSRYEDVGAEGLLPLFGDYPEEKVVEYLEANDWAKLTPTLATKFPTLTDSFGVHPWECPRCSSRHRHGEVEWDGDLKSPPLCPSCKADGIPVELVEPSPENQRVVGEQ